MTNIESIDQNNQDSNTAICAAELAVIGEVVSTVGVVISTIAAVLALEEERQEESDNKNMQKQIYYLSNEVKKLKKNLTMRNHGILRNAALGPCISPSTLRATL